jgi:hypothetical protein
MCDRGAFYARRASGSQRLTLLGHCAPHGLREAYDLRSRHPRLAAALEAAILAEITCAEIANLFGVSVDGVNWYEIAFFDVRDRLAHTGFIVLEVIERARERQPKNWSDYGWKLVAYQAGADTLQEVMGLESPGSLQGLAPSLRASAIQMLEDRLRVAAQFASADELLRVTRALRIVQDQALKIDGPKLDIYAENVKAVLDDLQWSVGPRRDPNHPLAEWDNLPVELNGRQMDALVKYGTFEGAEELKKKKMPPPGRARWEESQ